MEKMLKSVGSSLAVTTESWLIVRVEKDVVYRSQIIKIMIDDLGPDLDLVEEAIPIPLLPSSTLELVFMWAASDMEQEGWYARWGQQDTSTKVEMIWVGSDSLRSPLPGASGRLNDDVGHRRAITSKSPTCGRWHAGP